MSYANFNLKTFWDNFSKRESPLLAESNKSKLRHQNVRKVIDSNQVLDDIPHQFFLRLVGLFDTIPAEELADGYKKQIAESFDKTRTYIDEQLYSDDGAKFVEYEMSDYVHNLHLLLIDIVPILFLEASLHSIKEEYRNHVGEVSFNLFLSSDYYQKVQDLHCQSKSIDSIEAVKAEYEKHFRFQYRSLVNEIRKAKLYEEHIEDTRGYLIESVTCKFLQFSLLPFTVISMVIIIYLITTLSETALVNMFFITAFSLSIILGGLGSFLSAILRVQGVRDNNQLAQNIIAFKYSAKAIKFSPLTGMIFAFILSLIFASKITGGSIFPDLGTIKDMEDIKSAGGELAKWAVWSFLAGFSERLVPDMVDRISEKAKKADEKAA